MKSQFRKLTKDLEHGSLQLACHGAGSHDASDLEESIEGDVSVVLHWKLYHVQVWKDSVSSRQKKKRLASQMHTTVHQPDIINTILPLCARFCVMPALIYGFPRTGTGGWAPIGAFPTLTLLHTPTAFRTILDLLAVTRRLLKLLDDEGGSGGNDVDLGLTVLDGELAGDLKSLPVSGSLGDVVSDLLGGLQMCLMKIDDNEI